MSVRRSRLLRLLVAMVLCLQSGLAMAHCLRLTAAQEAFRLVVCTPNGLVDIDAPTDPDGPAKGKAAQAGFCLACHVLPDMVLPGPVIMALPVPLPTAGPLLAWDDAALPQTRAPPYVSTGPPALS